MQELEAGLFREKTSNPKIVRFFAGPFPVQLALSMSAGNPLIRLLAD
jgi:hypothetical protein